MNCPNCNKENRGTSKFCSGCGGDLEIEFSDEPLEVGTILENRYQIINQLNYGGMSTIYKAKVLKLNSICAVKELLPPEGSIHEQAEAMAWFNREAKLLARLDHPNLPRVFDYFVDKGKYYLVMNFVEGRDLDDIIEKEGTPGLPEEKVIAWSKELLEVLDYLHNQNPPIVYRDLKPSNIMIHKDGRVVLIDFGIARAVRQQDISTKTVIGTDGYAPLEQYEGRPEPRSDLYALGATMHNLLTGRIPVPLNIPPVKEIRPDISDEMEAFIKKATQRKAGDRFSSAREMLEALDFKKEKTEEDKKPSQREIYPPEKEKVIKTPEKADKTLKLEDFCENILLGLTFREIYFLDLNNGWVSGDGGIILYATNVGVNWKKQKSGVSSNLYGIHFHNKNHGWAAGAGGTILHTEDGGNKWNIQKSGISANLYSIYFSSGTHGWAAGDGGTIVHTEDGGNTGWLQRLLGGPGSWKTQKSNTSERLRSVHFIDDKHGWIAGEEGTILSTCDGGDNWSKHSTSTFLTSLYFASKNCGWAVGKGGKIFSTPDGGKNWKEQKSGTEAFLTDVCFFDEKCGWITGVTSAFGGIILHTSDGGITWTVQKDDIPKPLTGIYFLNLYNGWAVTYNGMIFHTGNGGKEWKSGQYLKSVQ